MVRIVAVLLTVFALVFSALPASASTQLVGYSTVQSYTDSDSQGQAEAFKYVASASGTSASACFYLQSPSQLNQPETVKIGLYSDNSGHPGSLLTSGTFVHGTNLVGGLTNCTTISGASVTANSTYWIAMLWPTGDGTVNGDFEFRDFDCGCTSGTNSETSSQTNLSSLPSTWSTGTGYGNAPATAYITN